MIHPTAIIHPKAKLHPTVRVGAYTVIDENVELGADCVVGPQVYLTGWTVFGVRNRIHAGSVIGDEPQDLKYKGAPTRVRIGDDNVFREQVTVNRATTEEGETVIGSNNFLMANCHVGHNCHLGNHVIIANGALLGGHVTVQDRAFISGNCLVHQFTRVGTLALMQGGSAISKDLPPFTIARGQNAIAGLNTVGLRRAGVAAEDRLELKRLYHLLLRGESKLSDAVELARRSVKCAAGKQMIEFIAQARRGVCMDIAITGETSGGEE